MKTCAYVLINTATVDKGHWGSGEQHEVGFPKRETGE
jgi:hypothetical protein